VNTVRRVVNALLGIVCALIGHRWEQQKGRFAGVLYSSPIRCGRCGDLASYPFQTGSEDYR
jgi:hypothetical protein